VAAESIASWLATYAIHSTALIAIAALAVLALSRIDRLRDFAAAIREWTWKIALLGGLATATAQAGLPIQNWRFEWAPAAPATEVVELHPASPTLEVATPWTLESPIASSDPRPALRTPTEIDPLIAPALFQLQTLATTPAETEPLFQTAELESPAAPATPDRPWPWLEIALAIWAAGIAIGLVRWGREWQRLRQCVRGRVRIESGLVFRDLEALRERAGYSRRVRLSCAPGIAAPLTMGLWHAEICLPPRALRGLQRDEIRAVLAHELAHAVRRDTAWLCLCRILEIVFFFQPLNRIVRRHLQEDVEALCDDWAVVHTGECVPLASSLTEIAGWIVNEHRRLPAPAMVVHGSALSQRVRRLLDEERAPTIVHGRLALTAIASVCCACAAVYLPGVTPNGTAHDVVACETCSEDSEDEHSNDSESEDEGECTTEVDVVEVVDCEDVDVAEVEEMSSDEDLESDEASLLSRALVLAHVDPPSAPEALDLSGMLEDIEELERALDSLQAEASVLRAHNLQCRLDALDARLESLRAMRARLYELLKQYPIYDQP
jgi:beta-lactamase regulating signal transducer with metallopeptidase domain